VAAQAIEPGIPATLTLPESTMANPQLAPIPGSIPVDLNYFAAKDRDRSIKTGLAVVSR